MITKKNVKVGDEFKRPSGSKVVVSKIEKDGFYYDDKKIGIGTGGWHSFKDGKYLNQVKK